jgi:hypothetical protein
MRLVGALSAVPVFVLSLMLSSSVAFAGVSWCEEDPLFLLNGNVLDLTTGVPAADAGSVKSIVYDVRVPWNALLTTVLVVPSRFPTKATISRTLPAWWGIGGMPVVANVTVHAANDFETYTRAISTTRTLVSTTPGRSNVTTTLKFKMLAP